MKKFFKALLKNTGYDLVKISSHDRKKHEAIYNKYKDFTMMPQDAYLATLEFTESIKHLRGCVVECGVWKGGMIAGMAEILGNNRKYFLCDSFEGLPDAKAIDGQSALDWQNNKTGKTYFDNCTANESFATKAMQLAGVDFKLVKGWFDTTLRVLNTEPIAFLRLDADWYDSMYCCLQNLYPRVIKNGVIIIDDYFVWDGCSKAVHTYLGQTSSRLYQTTGGVTYIIKND